VIKVEMRHKLFIPILFTFVNFCAVSGQDEFVSCYFSADTHGYACDLLVYNPTGLDNFTDINGTHLAGRTDADVKRIYAFAATNTSNVPSIICDRLINVEAIYYQSIRIQRIDEGSFRGCKKMTFLQISYNKIAEIHENSFKENVELKTLKIWSNNLTTLHETVFENLAKLEELGLEGNRISDLPDNVFKSLVNLKDLRLNANQLTAIKPEWFETLVNLNVLYLYNNQLTDIPRNAFSSLINLTTIWLDQNRLQVIHSESFGTLPKLHSLYAFNNRIMAVDERFIENTGINYIQMGNNVCCNNAVSDNSAEKEVMKNELKVCFENYEELYAGEYL
jgi:hypothetical protein